MLHLPINVVIESKIPFIKGLLEPYANVTYLNPTDFTPESVKDADAMIIRTRTHCDEALLSGSKVKMIATATIGTDHIDKDWCATHGIDVANAPGCNAPAVAQYVMASINAISDRPISDHTLGIIGVGNVGKIVERWGRQLGMKVLVNDPPRMLAEGGDQWSTLEEIAETCDVITVHTPLDDSTYHLIDENFLKSLRRKPIIINAARGPIVDTPALVKALDEGVVKDAVIDCWEGEPSISPTLLVRAAIATPHIAGYSHEGKVRATRMALDAICRHFSLPYIKMSETVPMGAAEHVTIDDIAASYDPIDDTKALKSSLGSFEALRNNYNLRHEP